MVRHIPYIRHSRNSLSVHPRMSSYHLSTMGSIPDGNDLSSKFLRIKIGDVWCFLCPIYPQQEGKIERTKVSWHSEGHCSRSRTGAGLPGETVGLSLPLLNAELIDL